MDEMAALNCADCRWNTSYLNEFYMVCDTVWNEACRQKPASILCVGCLEERIGRRLTPYDFIDCPLHDPNEHKQSNRLRARLGPHQWRATVGLQGNLPLRIVLK